MSQRDEFFEELLDLFEKHIEAKDVRTENEYKEMILEFIQKRDIDDVESDDLDRLDYEEETGTTPQDLYNERNSYAIRQSEDYERFRNEY